MDGQAPSSTDGHDHIREVLAALESVFSGDGEFEDAFEQLDFHTARVRRDFPNLYRVLRNPPGLVNSVQAALDDGSLHDVEGILTRVMDGKLAAVAPIIASAVIAAIPRQPIMAQAAGPAVSYQPQAQAQAIAAVPVDDGFGGKILETPLDRANHDATAALPPGMQIYDYQPWATQLAPSSHMGQKWAIRWDTPTPMKAIGETVTVRGPDARYRFAVREQVDAQVQMWELIKLLPYGRGG